MAVVKACRNNEMEEKKALVSKYVIGSLLRTKSITRNNIATTNRSLHRSHSVVFFMHRWPVSLNTQSLLSGCYKVTGMKVLDYNLEPRGFVAC